MRIDEVNQGISKHRRTRRLGRGNGSGQGKTSGRGHKGFYSRAGSSRRTGFEGGQMPLFRRVAKRGFNNAAFASEVVIINVGQLESVFDSGTEITPELLVARGIVPSKFDELKVLGDGELTKKFSVSAHRFSASAEAKISAVGGTWSVLV